jgi:hypothetical protein
LGRGIGRIDPNTYSAPEKIDQEQAREKRERQGKETGGLEAWKK